MSIHPLPKLARLGLLSVAVLLIASTVAASACALPLCNARFCSGLCSQKCQLLDGTKTSCGAQYPDICIPAAASSELVCNDASTGAELQASVSTASAPESLSTVSFDHP
ncbi:MAG TPA: hypothetical protein PK413_11775 [Thermoanaerobaculia bacterium]|nr:hypothetical protein [Thermoanaerobaculia bacterium]